MDPQHRFEIVAPIAQGDYATVYRARDRDLGREVAIKQIHQQYLQDPRQLERYWHEAQLLARLEHPHIMTIYDIVRERGWLVLELMQGSLQQLLAGRPIDLNDLRMAILYTTHALQFLEQHGILHGDVKPSNLLVDKNHRVKLGDFGIARRITGEHGSVVKGTTKYMAPEVVSDQFGSPGPHSDLYSLGFSAFELMCGEQFESLFPGLNVFGRDRQIAWMMWHSAPDRRLPAIHRVLQGVPDDLAYVIPRLCEKDPAKRYRTAEQVIQDLRRGAVSADPTPQEVAQQQQAAAHDKRRRRLAIAACVVSVGLSLGMGLWMPSGDSRQVATTKDQRPKDGVIGEIDTAQQRFFVVVEKDPTPRAVAVEPQDRIYVNDQRATLDDLRRDDRVRISYLRGETDAFKEIFVTRPELKTLAASVASIDMSASSINVAVDGSDSPLQLFVPDSTPVEINGQSIAAGRSLRYHDLKPQDRLTISHVTDEMGRLVARSIRALRTTTLAGKLEAIDVEQKQITVIPDAGSNKREWTVADDCVVSINGAPRMDDRPYTSADLIPGDRVAITQDIAVHRIDATREVSVEGRVVEINVAQQRLAVEVASQRRQFLLRPACRVQLAGQDMAATLADVRVDDVVRIDFDTLAPGKFEAKSLVVTPAEDPHTWAILVGQSSFDDARIPPLPYTAHDVQTLRETLVYRYRVPESQILLEVDAPRAKLEQDLLTFLPRITAGSQLICYFGGHAFRAGGSRTILAARDIDLSQLEGNGWQLKWLLSQLEGTKAEDKLLLLDTCHESRNDIVPLQPSSAEQAESLKEGPRRPVSPSVSVIASCDRGQRGISIQNGSQGLFGAAVATAFEGEADANGDHRIDQHELSTFLVADMARSAGALGKRQTPTTFPADATPPRLAPAARQAVRDMLAHLKDTKLEDRVLSDARAMETLAPRQPDIVLAIAMVLHKNGRVAQAMPLLDRLAAEFPDVPIQHQILAWQHFQQGKYKDGISDLNRMIRNLPQLGTDPQREAYVRHAYEFAGVLDAYAVLAVERGLSDEEVAVLEKTVAERGVRAKELFDNAAATARQLTNRLTNQISETTNRDRRLSLELERKTLSTYIRINYDLAAEYLSAGLNE